MQGIHDLTSSQYSNVMSSKFVNDVTKYPHGRRRRLTGLPWEVNLHSHSHPISTGFLWEFP